MCSGDPLNDMATKMDAYNPFFFFFFVLRIGRSLTIPTAMLAASATRDGYIWLGYVWHNSDSGDGFDRLWRSFFAI